MAHVTREEYAEFIEQLGIDYQKASIISAMKTMTEIDRLEIINQFCHHCGSNDPRCQCWNDE